MPPAAFAVACPGIASAPAYFTVSGGVNTTNNVYSAWYALPSALGSTQLLTSSPDANVAFAFGNSSATPATMLSWVRTSQTWSELDTPGTGLGPLGLPAGAIRVYVVDIAVTGVIWLAVVDAAGANRVFYKQPSRAQLLGQTDTSPLVFSESPVGTVCSALPVFGAIVALPNGNALATTAAAPYTLYSMGTAGCLGSLAFSSLTGGSGLAPQSILVTASLYTVYTVLIAAAPVACVSGGTCAGAAAVYAHATTYNANYYSALTSASDWTAVAMPSGAGVSYLAVAVSAGYVYGVAPFCMTAASVAGCACGAGYPLLVTANAGVSWSVAGCVPIRPTSMLAPTSTLLYIAGVKLTGGLSAAPIIVASANSGRRWVNLTGTSLPESGLGCTIGASGSGMQLSSLGLLGGPIIASGLDNAHHGDPNDSPYACSGLGVSTNVATCTSNLCPGWQTFLTAADLINNASNIASNSDVAVLGVDPTSSAISGYSNKAANTLAGNAGVVYQVVCNQGLQASYWFGQSTTGQNISAFFDQLAWGLVRPAFIWIVEARSNWPITPSDQVVLAGYGSQLATYCSNGGGLLSSTQYNGDMGTSAAFPGPLGTHYEFLQTMAPFMTISLSANTNLVSPSLTKVCARSVTSS